MEIRQRQIQDEATERIRDMIVEGRLSAGEWINETEFCQQLQISRTPLREALKVLVAKGLVELAPRRGAHVSHLSSRELVDLFEALSGVKGLAAELAAIRIPAADLEKLRQLRLRIERRHLAKARLIACVRRPRHQALCPMLAGPSRSRSTL